MKFLCMTSDLTDASSRSFVLDGQKLFAVRRDQRAYVYVNRCPHRGVALEWVPDQFLDPSASLIQCATHGALFLIENGECVAGPCAGQSLTAIPCREDSQGIWVQL
ncbi:Rieske (2Fe-2S) protein [Pseudomonas chlororaphis]|uniref:Rieske (2Fe-2S) protein n=1 Tax=Pseudomonas chlororaphis TaxID=587753 RepID=UPI0039E2D9B6